MPNLLPQFLTDAGKMMDLLLKAQTNQEEMADDDPQVSYLISAWARICKIMGKRFEPYLPLVMGPVLKTASLKPEVSLMIFLNVCSIDIDKGVCSQSFLILSNIYCCWKVISNLFLGCSVGQ